MECCWGLSTASRHREIVPGSEGQAGRVRAARPSGAQSLQPRPASPVPLDRLLQEAYVDFLQRWEWEWFCTLTFRHDAHPEAAARRFDGFVARINRRLHGPRWYKHQVGIQWVRALEHQRRGVIHFHAVVAGIAGERPATWEQVWHDLAGYARIEPIRDTVAVLHYLTKYVRRGGELEFEPRMRAPASPPRERPCPARGTSGT
jgi:hypothetical protein